MPLGSLERPCTGEPGVHRPQCKAVDQSGTSSHRRLASAVARCVVHSLDTARGLKPVAPIHARLLNPVASYWAPCVIHLAAAAWSAQGNVVRPILQALLAVRDTDSMKWPSTYLLVTSVLLERRTTSHVNKDNIFESAHACERLG
jgi:hypothetical protein